MKTKLYYSRALTFLAFLALMIATVGCGLVPNPVMSLVRTPSPTLLPTESSARPTPPLTATSRPVIVTENWTSTPPITSKPIATYTPSVTPIKPTATAPVQTRVPPGSWQRISTLPRQINAFVADPSNPRMLYAGTGDNGSGSGVYKSDDAGETWRLTAAGLPSEDARALAVIRPDNLLAIVGVRAYVYTSTDGAKTWAKIGDSGLFGGYWMKLFPVSSQSQSLFVVSRGQSLARTNNGGQVWTPLRAGLPADENSIRVQSLAMDSTNPNTLYVGVGGFVGGGAGVYKSTDGGNTWSASNVGMIDYRITAVALDPKQPQTIYAGSDKGELFKSTDGGKKWNELTDKLPIRKDQHAEIREIVIDPTASETVYLLCNQVGVLLSRDGGVNWDMLGKPAGENMYAFTAINILFGSQPVVLIGAERAGAWRYVSQ